MYTIFEGVDTTGKSTQIELFKNRHKSLVTTKEPGGTNMGIKLREIILQDSEKLGVNAELFLFLADRAEHYKRVVEPSLVKNYVISDRGLVSGIAYALANHPELDIDFLLQANKFALNGNLPNRVVLFLTDEKLINLRLKNKKQDNIEQRGIRYLLEVQILMKKIVEKLRIEHIEVDSNDSIENIYKQIEGFIYD